jgi:hypothetical protein
MSIAIGTINELVTVIRTRLGGAGAAAGRRAPDRAGAGRRYTYRNLKALIETRVQQIRRDDPQRGHKAFRVFLEAVFLTHLGEELMNDPRFYPVLDDVHHALESDASSAALVKQAVDQLLSIPPPGTSTRR